MLDPVGSDGKSQLGTRELKKGPDSFFLHPGQPFLLSTGLLFNAWNIGENLAEGIQAVHVLLSDEALLLTAVKEFDDVTPQGINAICTHAFH